MMDHAGRFDNLFIRIEQSVGEREKGKVRDEVAVVALIDLPPRRVGHHPHITLHYILVILL